MATLIHVDILKARQRIYKTKNEYINETSNR